MAIYKFSGRMHLWSWLDFKQEIEGQIVDYEVSKNVIYSITLKTDMPKEEAIKIAKSYGLRLEK